MNTPMSFWVRTARTLGFSAALACTSVAMAAPAYTVTPLVTDDQTAHPAQITDAGLTNAWGLSYSPSSPFWVSSNGAGTATLYSVNPSTQLTAKVPLTISIPGTGSVTGQIFNGGAGFNADRFLFVSEDGTISGWRGALGTTAEILVSASSANVYKGAAFGSTAGNDYLYAANFRSGTIDVFKGNAAAPTLLGNFVDPTLPAGYAPFNVQNLGGTLYVTYAQQDASRQDEVAGAGLGLVNRFDLNGNLLGRVASAGSLNAPWGLAIAPGSFGSWAGALLVGNFGDGRISAFDGVSNAYLGQLLDASSQPLTIGGLWGLAPGNGAAGGSTQSLYFTAGPDAEAHGLFGVLTAVPEPGTYALLLAALAILVGVKSGRGRLAVCETAGYGASATTPTMAPRPDERLETPANDQGLRLAAGSGASRQRC